MLQIKTDKFEGPLGLLLQLIEKEELDITEVSLAKIADQYVDYIKNSQHISPETIADFLVIAAKLLLIKSRALLPYLSAQEEEEIEELEQQLKMYKEFLEASKKVEAIIKQKRFTFTREFSRKAMLANINSVAGLEAGFFSPPKKLKANDLFTIFKDLLKRIKPTEEELEEERIEYKINIEDQILAIQQMLINRIRVSFDRILANTKSKTEIIVSFLAMLELMKQRNIVVRQDGLFDKIMISKI